MTDQAGTSAPFPHVPEHRAGRRDLGRRQQGNDLVATELAMLLIGTILLGLATFAAMLAFIRFCDWM